MASKNEDLIQIEPSVTSPQTLSSSSTLSSSTPTVTAAPTTATTIQSSLKKVYLSSEAFHFCLTQCLSTEVEEVMGLLIGELDQANGICYVTNSLPLKRLDKRKDRVEIGTEQLASSFSVVDELTKIRSKQKQHEVEIFGTATTKKFRGDLQVVGWYHSHPHITVFPSEVDIATHHQYQSTMSPFWLGLIFGCFNYDDTRAMNRFQLVGFQSVELSSINSRISNGVGASGNKNGNGVGVGAGVGGRPSLKHAIVPITIEPRSSPQCDQWALRKASQLIDLLLEEEKEAFRLNQGVKRGRGESTKGAGDVIGKHYNACVYSKAVAKIITLLGSPMIDTWMDKREKSIRSILEK